MDTGMRGLTRNSTKGSMTSLRTVLASSALAFAAAFPKADGGETKEQVVAAYGKLPIQFEANGSSSGSDLKFLSRGREYTIFLAPGEAVLSLRRMGKLSGPSNASWQPEAAGELHLKLAGGNAQAKAEEMDALPGRVNYLLGNDKTQWRTGIATFGKVKYENVYPGIDLVYYGNQRNLEYDFVLAPGADSKAIQLEITGAESTVVDTMTGDLVLALSGHEVRFHRPLIYQPESVGSQRTTVKGSYVARENRVSFEVGPYDRSRVLIVDPKLAYSTFVGGSDFDQATSIAIDSTGAAYITGYTCSTNFPGLGAPGHAVPGTCNQPCNG
jgi:hypothetical protein